MGDHISVCVCTYRRNSMLARLLRNLALQDTHGRFTFSVVVVDNDPSGPAQAEVARLRSELSMEIVYGVEPERTIPAARNHGIRLAKGNFIGIMDDDEFPPPHWLITLYEAVRTFEVDGALGPVIPFFEQHPPAWLKRSGLCDLPQWRTGTLLQWHQTRTGNVLLKKDVFDRYGICFDETFRTGGSDQAFFRHAMRLGFRFVAVEEAPVYEIVPPERWSKSYFLRRALVNGFNAQKYLATEGRKLKSITAILKSAIAVSVYTVIAPVCACIGTHVLMNCMERGFYHLSRLSAAFGIELWKRRNF
jgi:glycosyltransferase involved in cell wall biosynthesis